MVESIVHKMSKFTAKIVSIAARGAQEGLVEAEGGAVMAGAKSGAVAVGDALNVTEAYLVRRLDAVEAELAAARARNAHLERLLAPVEISPGAQPVAASHTVAETVAARKEPRGLLRRLRGALTLGALR